MPEALSKVSERYPTGRAVGAAWLQSWGGISRLLLFFGRRTGPKRSGAVLACLWADFQAKPSILEPIRVIFDDLSPNRHSGRELDLQDQARDWPGGIGLPHMILCFLTKPEIPIWNLTPSE